MRILIVGGTRFIGRAIAEAAQAAGHEVTLLHRGRTGSDLFPDSEHLLGDRNTDLSVLTGRSFDATVDVCGFWPRQVRGLAEALGGRGGQHVYISSISAYADPTGPGGDESLPLTRLEGDQDPDDVAMSPETYGPLKTHCEEAAAKAYGTDGLTIVRPCYVVGPHDYSGRFTWWVDRLATGGPMLAPGPATSPLQLIDARDHGAWVVGLVESGTTGPFHVCAPAPPWSFGDMIAEITKALDSTAEPVWVDGAELAAAGVTGAELPLWSEGADEHVLALNPSAAFATGLTPRPLAETIRDTAEWIATADWRRDGVGIDADREAELLARFTR